MERTEMPTSYQVHEGIKDFERKGLRVIPFHTFCMERGLPRII